MRHILVFIFPLVAAHPAQAEIEFSGTFALGFQNTVRGDQFEADYLTSFGSGRAQGDTVEIVISRQGTNYLTDGDQFTFGQTEIGIGYRITPNISLGIGSGQNSHEFVGVASDSADYQFAYATVDTPTLSVGVLGNIDDGTTVSYELFGTAKIGPTTVADALVVRWTEFGGLTDRMASVSHDFGALSVDAAYMRLDEFVTTKGFGIGFDIADGVTAKARYTRIDLGFGSVFDHWQIGGAVDLGHGLTLDASYGQADGPDFSDPNTIMSLAVSYDLGGSGARSAWEARSDLYRMSYTYPLD